MNESQPKDDRLAVPRLVASVVAFAPAIFALLILRKQFRDGLDGLGVILWSVAALIAFVGWWFALRGHLAETRIRIRSTMIGAAIVGGIGFLAGFFGPLIFTPNANQGPLVGIFITGPLGFIVGAVIGYVYSWARRPSLNDRSDL
ncbi:MAG: drug efflux pump, inner rane subunit, DrrB family [Planctomycetaceae bacterium]|nr:drug efflux pump, inner rane subunit, DrrB family [Planctomycetaceae bacterium]